MFSQNRDEIRQTYLNVWQKRKTQAALTGLEQQIAQVMQEHPEYHPLLDHPDASIEAEFPPELGQSNPFLHMGLHLALREQVSTNRPAGIRQIYDTLLQKHKKPLTVEHIMMDPLVEAIWQAQRQGTPPDEAAYLEALNQLQ